MLKPKSAENKISASFTAFRDYKDFKKAAISSSWQLG